MSRESRLHIYIPLIFLLLINGGGVTLIRTGWAVSTGYWILYIFWGAVAFILGINIIRWMILGFIWFWKRIIRGDKNYQFWR